MRSCTVLIPRVALEEKQVTKFFVERNYRQESSDRHKTLSLTMFQTPDAETLDEDFTISESLTH